MTNPNLDRADGADNDVDDTLLDIVDVGRIVKQCSRAISKHVKAGRFPPPIRLGRSVRWKKSSISRFLACNCDMAFYTAGEGH